MVECSVLSKRGFIYFEYPKLIYMLFPELFRKDFSHSFEGIAVIHTFTVILKIHLEMEWVDLRQLLYLKTLMVRHGGSSAGSYHTDPTSPIPSHCAVIILFRSVPVHQLSWLAL